MDNCTVYINSTIGKDIIINNTDIFMKNSEIKNIRTNLKFNINANSLEMKNSKIKVARNITVNSFEDITINSSFIGPLPTI